MQLSEAIKLIDGADWNNAGKTWVDLGCGEGLFTQALAHQLAEGSSILAVDKERSIKKFTVPGIGIDFLKADFIRDDLHLPELDGVLMANALHYVKDKIAFLDKIRNRLKPAAKFLLIEYDTDKPVPVWVPYPLSFDSANQLFSSQGFASIKKLEEKPSVYGRANIYSALIS